MLARLVCRIGLMLLALTFGMISAHAQTRIVAIGDLHGDYEAYHAIVRAAGLVDARGRWSGGSTILVQTGDIVDRGPDSLRIIRHLTGLRRQAARAGGRIVTLVGNHEAMNVTGDLRYVHPGEYAAFADRRSAERRERAYSANRAAIIAAYRARDAEMDEDAIRRAWIESTPLGQVEHRAAWRPEGELGRWAAANPAVALIEGNLFVHGGIGPAYASVSIMEINRRVAEALAARDVSPTAIINDPEGPLWYRGLASQPDAAQVDTMLSSFGARRIVIGHTPVPEGIAMLHGRRVICIDTGISAAYGGKRSWLEIRGESAVAHVVGEEQTDS